MRPLMLYVLLPLSAMAATAVPTDPARAAVPTGPRAVASTAAEKAAQPALVETKEVKKLEAL